MGKLELRRERGMLRHYLDGELVEVGARLEVLLRGGQWITGSYDWNGVEARWPGLRFELGGPWEVDSSSMPRPPSGVMALHPDAMLRWPRMATERRGDSDPAGSTMPMRRLSPHH
jgi:hypothetical protein